MRLSYIILQLVFGQMYCVLHSHAILIEINTAFHKLYVHFIARKHKNTKHVHVLGLEGHH